MPKILLSLFSMVVLLTGCITDEDRENACAEVTETRVFESSKRMDILKSYGYTPVQAKVFESGLMKSFKFLDEVSEMGGDEDKAGLCLAINDLLCTQILERVEANDSESAFSSSSACAWYCQAFFDANNPSEDPREGCSEMLENAPKAKP